MTDEMTDAEINELKKFINSNTGKKLLLKVTNQEVFLLAEAYNTRLATTDKQIQLVNKVAGLHWVRSLIEDLATKK